MDRRIVKTAWLVQVAGFILFAGVPCVYAHPTTWSSQRPYVITLGQNATVSIPDQVLSSDPLCSFSFFLQSSSEDSLAVGINTPASASMPSIPLLSKEFTRKNGRDLPALPGTLLLGLIGFLCVLLIKKIKVWIALFVSAASLIQGSLSACLSQRSTKRETKTSLKQCPHSKSFFPLSADRSTVDFLLRGAILPRLKAVCPCDVMNGSDWKEKRLAKKDALSKTENPFELSIACISLRDIFQVTPALERSGAKQHMVFSPGFIFENLARGPPL